LRHLISSRNVIDAATEKRHDQRGGQIRRRQHTESRDRKGKKTADQTGRTVLHTRLLDRSDHHEPVQSSEHCEVYRHHI